MKKLFHANRIVKIICLLLTVGILSIIPSSGVYATEVDSHLTGSTEERTNIEEPGTASTPEELSELNIANTHFTRSALNTQTAPPNQVLIGLALFLTFFIMRPYMTQIYEEAVVPMEQGEIDQQEFFERGIQPLREFMYKQTQTEDVDVFMDISGDSWESGALDDISLSVLAPAFMVGQLREAFIIGFIIYIPFIVIDMVVSSALMSMGMMMLPPTTISMPFKILLFVLADGWNLIIVNLVRTFK